MIEDIKVMLEINNTDSDPVLNIMIRDATKAVCLYCHRSTLPENLEFVVRELVINKVKSDNNVQSVKRGDTQINYATAITADGFTQLHYSAMNHYRRFRVG